MIEPLTHENHLHPSEPKWFAICTRYKREKYVCRLLNRKGIISYLPIQKVTRKYTRKIKHVELPLMNCYVFVQIVKSEYVKVLETEQVMQFVRIGKNLLSIPEKEIDLIRRILGESISVTAEKTTYREGDKVEIASGNLAGVEGTLIRVEGKSQVLVDLQFLGYTLSMHIDPSLLIKKNTLIQNL